ncbi:scarecrow-like protein 18 [Cynara cardunculus var. scolymus]|uniref:Transcription factor GRAS n=1 Tax=Cynara cardunculus var. scolymus TaxID=59895 RepID=A0A103Y4J4_CYNCS|nr:scarecrow-like protein 18 [Cynara cardunculus var. scolymus]KVI02390.1 Transcription factor GRAS [Cynara cardunculus var. scolymus]
MLGSSSCSQHHHQEQQQQQEVHLQTDPSPPPPPPPPGTAGQLHHHQIQQHQHQEVEMVSRLSSYTPPSIYLRQLLSSCAQSISNSDFAAAHRITTILSSNSSPYGDSSERLIHSFTKALSLRIRLHLNLPTPFPIKVNNFSNNSSSNYHDQNDDAILQSSYLSLNQITPFIRFSQLTANQAILEAIDQPQPQNHSFTSSPQPHDIHILDFDIMHGVQWPPLMQAIADRHHPPTLRITATGTNLDILRRTGDRLSKFAHSLGLRFRFFPLLLPDQTNNHHTVDDVINHLSAVLLLPNEILAVNCVLYLHRLLIDRDKLCLLLRKIKAMNPKVVTLAEREANHNHPLFLSRFEEALSYYTAIFDSLEATLPPNSRERMEVEQVWFGREIADIVTAEGEKRRERHERFLSWEMMMRIAGFRNVALSPFALSQAKLLLRLHYPSEGYNLEVVNDSFFLGWQNKPLFSVSSWY